MLSVESLAYVLIVFCTLCPFSMTANGDDGWFLERLEVLCGKVESDDRDPDRDPGGYVQSRIDMGDALLVTHEYAQAISQYELALKLQEQEFRGLTGQDIVPGLIARIRILTRIGNALLDFNQNSRALGILNQAISLASWGVASEHDAVRDLRTAHALSLVHTLPIGEVDAFYGKLYGSAVNAYPQANPVFARILDRWAVIDVSNGKTAEAIDHVRQSVDIKEKAFGPQHPFVADSLAMLASLEYAHGDRALVDGLLRRVLDIRTKAFGEAHPLTQAARENLERR